MFDNNKTRSILEESLTSLEDNYYVTSDILM